jgi:hypothetical protein
VAQLKDARKWIFWKAKTGSWLARFGAAAASLGEPDSGLREKNLVDPASNICLDGGLSHANVRISRLRQICGRLSKKGKKKEGEKDCG